MTTSSEQIVSLVRRAQRGDKDAYRVLVEMFEGRIRALAFGIVRSREEAEDVAQEAFVKAYLSLNQFEGKSSFYTWLYRITVHMALDERRRIARRGARAEAPDEAAHVVDPAASPEDAAFDAERRGAIQAALGGLSKEHRAVIVLREIEGYSYEEIASMVGTSLGTVMSRIHYARKKLQAELAGLRRDH